MEFFPQPRQGVQRLGVPTARLAGPRFRLGEATGARGSGLVRTIDGDGWPLKGREKTRPPSLKFRGLITLPIPGTKASGVEIILTNTLEALVCIDAL